MAPPDRRDPACLKFSQLLVRMHTMGSSPDEIPSEARRDHIVQPLSVDSGLVGGHSKLLQDNWLASAILGFGVIDDPIGAPLQLVSILTPVVRI